MASNNNGGTCGIVHRCDDSRRPQLTGPESRLIHAPGVKPISLSMSTLLRALSGILSIYYNFNPLPDFKYKPLAVFFLDTFKPNPTMLVIGASKLPRSGIFDRKSLTTPDPNLFSNKVTISFLE